MYGHHVTGLIQWLSRIFVRGEIIVKSSRQRRRISAISWRQHNGNMAESDRGHVIVDLQNLKVLQEWTQFWNISLGLIF